MPTLSLRIAPLHNPAHDAALAEQLTARVLHKRPEVTAVMIDDLPAARFCIGGVASEQAVACQVIDITEGTNLRQEKQQFVYKAQANATWGHPARAARSGDLSNTRFALSAHVGLSCVMLMA